MRQFIFDHNILWVILALIHLVACQAETAGHAPVVRATSTTVSAVGTISTSTSTYEVSSPTLQPLIAPTSIELAVSKLIFTPEATFTPYLTETQIPTIPSLMPTMLPEESKSLIQDWMENPLCALPCWWGTLPGETTWKEVEGLLNYLGLENFVDKQYKVQSTRLYSPDNIHATSLIYFYFTHDDILEFTSLEIAEANYYPVELVLIQYGQPDEIMMSAIFNTPTGESVFRFVLGYWQLGFVIVYEEIVPYDTTIGWIDNGVGCLRSPAPINMMLWNSQETHYGWEDMYDLQVVEGGHPYLPLADATGVSVKDFYDMFVNTSEPLCLETPLALWEPENFQWCVNRKIPIEIECSVNNP